MLSPHFMDIEVDSTWQSCQPANLAFMRSLPEYGEILPHCLGPGYVSTVGAFLKSNTLFKVLQLLKLEQNHHIDGLWTSTIHNS